MAAAVETKKISLKLQVDSRANIVVFAEAEKDFVDFLCDILSMPINTVIRVLKDREKGMAGSLVNIYESIDALNDDFMQPNMSKDLVLKPRTAMHVPLLSVSDAPTILYRCSSHPKYWTSFPGELCPDILCHRTMSGDGGYKYVPPRASADPATGGYVKGQVKYMVWDNLVVNPLTTALIKTFVKDIASLEEKDVQVGLEEGLAMLKASLETQAVLTAVFLGNNKMKF